MSRQRKDKADIIPIPSSNSFFKKSNVMIQAAYRSSALSQKILSVAMAFPQYLTEEGDGSIYCRIPVPELRKLLRLNSGSSYQQISKACAELTGTVIGVHSEDFKDFLYLAPVIKCKSKEGTLEIEFNHSLKSELIRLQKNYSRLSLEALLLLKKPYSMRLYELIKSKCYHLRDDNRSEFQFSYTIAELKLKLGVISIQDRKVRGILNGKRYPDYDRAVSEASEQMFESWFEFRRKCLQPAIDEINSTPATGLEIDWTPTQQGVGGRVIGVEFNVKFNDHAPKIEDDVIDIDERLDEINEILNKEFKIKDIKAIGEAACYDIEKVRVAKMCLDQSGTVQNPVGFLLSAIKNGYTPSEPRKKGWASDFKQHDYDFQELKQKLVANH